MLDANDDRRVDAAAVQEAHGRLAAQHGRLEHLAQALLRSAAAVLSVRVRAPERDRLAGGARGARASPGSTSSRSCTGRGSTPCRSAARQCDARRRAHRGGGRRLARRRHRPFLDARLAEPDVDRARLRDRRVGRACRGADLPDHAYWEKWFPADWVSEMREQIRLWFYSQCFMSVALDRPRRRIGSVLTYEKVLDEHGQADAQVDRQRDRAGRRARPHGRRRHALALLRADAERAAALRLRARRRRQARACSRFWNSVVVLRRRTRTSPASRRRGPSLQPSGDLAPLDRWLVERTHAFVRDGRGRRTRRSTPSTVMHAYESYADDLSNWYIRRSRRRFWNGERVALETLWYALVQTLRVAVAGDAVPHRAPVAQSRAGRAGVGASRRRGPRSPSPTGRCSRRSPTCAASSRSRIRRARRAG